MERNFVAGKFSVDMLISVYMPVNIWRVFAEQSSSNFLIYQFINLTLYEKLAVVRFLLIHSLDFIKDFVTYINVSYYDPII